MDILALDFGRIFLGEQPPLFFIEVLVRTLIMYTYTLFAVRYLGKRGVGQLTAFDFVVVILLGSAAGDPMFYDDVPLLYGILTITIVVLVERAINVLSNRNRRVEALIEDSPTLVVKNGTILVDTLRSEQISPAELLMELRAHGVRDTGEVELAYLEPSGKVSIFKFPEGQQRQGESTLPS